MSPDYGADSNDVGPRLRKSGRVRPPFLKLEKEKFDSYGKRKQL
jgi:hypothetical protein